MSEGRRGGREARRAVRQSVAVRSLPALRRRLPLYEVLTQEQLDRLHDTAMRVVEEIGIEFREDEALAVWAKAGAKVDGARVRIPRELLMALVELAPQHFTLHARDPGKSAEIGGDTMVFGPTYGSPFVRGFDGERRLYACEGAGEGGNRRFRPHAGRDGARRFGRDAGRSYQHATKNCDTTDHRLCPARSLSVAGTIATC